MRGGDRLKDTVVGTVEGVGGMLRPPALLLLPLQ